MIAGHGLVLIIQEVSSMYRRVSLVACAATLAVLALSVSCSRKPANEPPVATPSLTLSHDKVPIGSPGNS